MATIELRFVLCFMKEKGGLSPYIPFIPASHAVLGEVWVITRGMARQPPEMRRPGLNGV